MKRNYAMAVMKKFKLSIQQDHAKTEEPARYAKRNNLQVYMDLHLKGRTNQTMMVLIFTHSNDLTVKSNCLYNSHL